ncbi:hypothetical protein E2C01_063803 [Portunus trituberculatus]|uniref:Uncharacterized protein n=1 Tax=Portunus trituberculatus TaxID=210409 RepID=A0A5B7HM16_PORTR|nr:hypothetical protein [Portunus trituberculatus]
MWRGTDCERTGNEGTRQPECGSSNFRQSLEGEGGKGTRKWSLEAGVIGGEEDPSLEEGGETGLRRKVKTCGEGLGERDHEAEF